MLTYSIVKPGTPVRPVPTTGVANRPPSDQETADDTRAEPEEQGEGLESHLVLAESELPLFNQQTKSKEAVIRWESASVNTESNIYNLLQPVATIFSEGGSEGLDVQFGDVRLTADQARVDRDRGVVWLSENVRAAGEGFEVRTDRVVYNVGDGSLASDAPVQIRTRRGAGREQSAPDMLVTGQGLSVDIGLRTMTIHSNVETRLNDVSPEFLAAGPEASAGASQVRDVVITCDGRMTYEHTAGKVVFHDNAEAADGERTLSCEQLTLLLSESNGRTSVEVTRIVADRDVVLTYREQIVQGEHLEWHNVLQTGTLTGDPCDLQTPDFRITGQSLTFYRLNTRFDAEGAGTLFWSTPQSPPEDSSEQTPQMLPQGSLTLSTHEPVRIAWSESMTYDLESRFASFAGDVVVEQRTSSLECDSLELSFAEGGGDIEQIVAEGNVLLHDSHGANERTADCHRFVWDAVQQSVQLLGSEGGSVTVTEDNRTIVSPRVLFNNADGSLSCPAAGTLSMQSADVDATTTTVRWERSMHYSPGKTAEARFLGSVAAAQGEQSIRGEEVIIRFDNEMAPKVVEAAGGAVVRIKGGSAALSGAALPAAEGDEATTWQLRGEEISILTHEQRVVCETPGDLEVNQPEGQPALGVIRWADRMELDSGEQRGVFSGDVEVKVEGADMNCAQLVLHVNDAGELRHARSDGEVTFRATGEEAWSLDAESAEAVFGPGNQLRQFLAWGNVAVSDEQRRLNCEKLTLTMKAGQEDEEPVIERLVAEGAVRVVWQQQQATEASGDRLEWTRETNNYVLTGEPMASVRQGGLVTTSRRIVLNRATARTVE